MTNKEFYREFGNIDPKMIEAAAPAEKVQKKKKNDWIKWASMAACFALVITTSMLLYPSIVEDISSDGYENLYLFGGITVNMNGMFWAFFIAPVFSVVCTFLMWLIDSGSIILPLWLIRDLCIPILHFCILKRCIKKNKIQKKSTIGLVIALLLVTVAADSFVLEYLILKGRLAIPHIIFRLIWAILCGLFILGHTLVERFYRNNIRCNIMVAVGSTIALCINAFMTYLLAPTLATKYAIDGIELLLMPLSIIILSVYSHLLGRIMTRRFMFVKLTGWLLGIIASEFVTLWLLGTPRILPTEDKVTTIIWIVVSAFVFIWCLIGVLKTHLEDIKQSLAEKRKPTNRTWVKWAALAACLCLIITAVLVIYDPVPDVIIPPNFESMKLPEGPYVITTSDWPLYSSAKDLINNADLVFIGKITGIDFDVLDSSTALPVSENTPNYARQLYTIYTVEISQTYKGDTTDVTKIRVMGGVVDYNIDTQLEVMEIGNAFGKENGIPILDNYYKVQCKIGNSYLFTLRQFETGYPTIMNVDQSVFDLNDPTRKQTIGNNPNVYYSGSKDEYNCPLISAKDVIMEFGKKEWTSFNKKWKQGVYSSDTVE